MRRLTRRQGLATAGLVIVAVSFVTLDVSGGGLRDAHGGARGALGALYRGTDAVLGPARRFVQGVPNVDRNQATIDALRRQNAQLRAQVDVDAANATTAAQLATLHLAAAAGGFTIAPARVIAFGPGAGFDWTATVDVGRSSGIAVDQTVIDGDALIGRVLHVDSSSSVILLAADPGSGVGVRDTRDGELAVATGAGAGGFTLSPLDPSADLRVGDELVTGPAGQSTYAAGLRLGTITAVRVAADGTTTASVRPAVTETTIDLVGVVLAAGPATAPRAAIVPSPATGSTSAAASTSGAAATTPAAASPAPSAAAPAPAAQAAGR
jgi:rod shape-determining protein MreC